MKSSSLLIMIATYFYPVIKNRNIFFENLDINCFMCQSINAVLHPLVSPMH